MNPILKYSAKDLVSQKMRATTNKIVWLRSQASSPGAKYDLTIKDCLGRIRVQKKDCGNETETYGELMNIPTTVGEELEIEISNIKNAEEINLFVN